MTAINTAKSIVTKDITSLLPYANNSRTHSDEQVAQIMASIQEFDFTNPVLIDDTGGIVAGHGRVMAASKLGMQTVPTISVGWLSEKQRRAYVIADNQLALNAGWDEEVLAKEVSWLQEQSFDTGLLGFDVNFLDELLAEDSGTSSGNTDPDDAPEPTINSITALGDVWVLGAHRLMCGDSTNAGAVGVLMDGHKADLVFTDPPYGVDYDGGHAVKGKRREKLQNDASAAIYAAVMPVVFSASKAGAVVYLWFGDSKAAAVIEAVVSAGYVVRNTLIWNKNVAQFGAIGAQYKSKHEPCLYCFKKGNAPYWSGPTNEMSVWDVKRCSRNEHHPTQKPVELAERAIGNSSKSGDIVVDFFGGSGSTLIGCEVTGRCARVMELSPQYCDVIVKRWQDFTGKQAVHAVTGLPFPIAPTTTKTV